MDKLASDYSQQSRPGAPMLLEKVAERVSLGGRCKGKDQKARHLHGPPASSPSVAAAMRGNTSNDTSPELLLRSALWKSGIGGYRKHFLYLPGRPDIVFPRYRLAVFVHGCFWHRCPKCNISIPRTNTPYWEEKLHRNIERDERVFSQLEQAGWHAMRLWECEIHHSLEWCVSQVRQELQQWSTNHHVSPMSETDQQ